jgi:hypothetical protein
MIGTIIFTKSGSQRVATLEDDHTWTVMPPSDDPNLAGVLQLIASHYAGPADGPFGPRQITQAKRYLMATDHEIVSTSLVPKKPLPPGTIY